MNGTRCLLIAAIAMAATLSLYGQPAAELKRASELFKQGSANYLSGKYDAAIVNYSEYLKIRPNVATGWYNRGLAYKQKAESAMNRADFERAEADLSQAIKLDPKDADFWLNRGHVRSRLVPVDFANKLPQAIADYTQVIKLRPNSGDGYTGRGRVYEESNQSAKALADLNKALQLNPNDPVAYFTRGKIHSLSKNYAAARSDLEKALRLYPEYEQAKSFLSNVNNEARKHTLPATVAQASPVATNSPSQSQALDDSYRRTEMAEKAGNNSQVVALATRSLEMIPMIGVSMPKNGFDTPLYIGLLRKRANALSAMGKHAESDLDFKEAGMASLKNVNRFLESATDTLQRDKLGSPAGWVLAELEAFKGVLACRSGVEGVKEWNAAVERTRPRDMAISLQSVFMLAGVRESCAMALTNYGDYQAGGEADAAKRIKQLNEALGSYNEAVGLSPRDPRGYTGRAKIYRKLGRNDLAGVDEQKARELTVKK